MKYEIRPARLQDLIDLFDNLRPIDQKAVNAFGGGDPDRWAAQTFLNSIAIFAMRDEVGRLYGVAGFQEIRSGVVTVWAVGSVFFGGRAAAHAIKFLGELFNHVEKNSSIHRIECYVLKEFDAGHRTVKRLGFVEEGVRHAAGAAREDAVIYARYKHEANEA